MKKRFTHQRVFGETPDIVSSRLRHTLAILEEDEPVKKMKWQPLLIGLMIVALCGAALAAAWGSRELITHTDMNGKTSVNEAMVELITPIGKTFENDQLKVEMVDAIFDGSSLVAAWTMTNKTQEDLYLLCDILMNGNYGGAGMRSRVDELFIKPGETIQSGFSCRTDDIVFGLPGNEATPADTCAVSMKFAAFAAKGEVVAFEIPMGEDGVSVSYTEAVDAIIEAGNVPIAPDGVIEFGSHYPKAPENATRADLLEASGMMERRSDLAVEFEMEQSVKTLSGLPDGKPVEQQNDGYTLRITRADITPNTATFTLERVFADEAAANAFAKYFETDHGNPCWWVFRFLDEQGSGDWTGNSGGGTDTERPIKQDDGTYVWNYRASMTDIIRIPKTITIIPELDRVMQEDQGLTLTFQE